MIRRFILFLVLGFVTATSMLAQAPPPYKRTILVGGAATPRANGTLLLKALATTGATGPTIVGSCGSSPGSTICSQAR